MNLERLALPTDSVYAMSPDAIGHVSECLSTLRSVRRFQRREVPDELIEFVLRHATKAGSGKNRQPWRFVVVRDAALRYAVASWYQETWKRIAAAVDTVDRQTASADTLAANMPQAPVIVVVCFVPGATNPASFTAGASIYPAVQNLMIAARAVGLGCTLTTVHDDVRAPGAGWQLRELLSIPGQVVPAAVIPVGYPARPFTDSLRRAPMHEVTFSDSWGCAWPHRESDATAATAVRATR